MSELDRRTRLCRQTAPPALTGIDFVQVVDHTTQDRLHVFFIVDPDLLREPGAPATPRIPEAATFAPADTAGMSITAAATGERIPVTAADWIAVTVNGVTRTVLQIDVPGPGSDAVFAFRYDHPAVDRVFAAQPFRFKQGCPTGLDCKSLCTCPEEDLPEVAIDYLARDFTSLRGALLDFAATHYPQWEARVEADQAMMLLEILAHLGDEFAYRQDRHALEAYLETATQTRSIRDLARLVDYAIDHGQAAVTDLAVGLTGPARFSRPRDPLATDPPDRAFALRADTGAIPFEAIERIWLHPDWNAVPLYLADSDTPCLEIGATEALFDIAPPDSSDPTTTPDGVALADPADVWVGRRIVLRSGRGDAGEPDRAWTVTPVRVEAWTDTLATPPRTVAQIAWDRAEALPFQMPIAKAVAHLNLVRAIAGQTVDEIFRVGSDAAFRTRHAGADAYQMRRILELPRAVERQGACSAGARGRVLRQGLAATEADGLAWDGSSGQAQPLLSLVEVEPDLGLPDAVAFDPAPAAQVWRYVSSILDADAEDRAFTVEPGMWSEVARFFKPAGDVALSDYSGNAGFSLRFGDRAFGIAPAEGTILRARYLTAPGTDANLPADTVTRLSDPVDPTDPPVPGMPGAGWVTNPYPITSARAAESLSRIRQNAPEAFRAILLRAVRAEDYRAILERRPTIQQANASARWTGSWTTDIVAVDPVGTTELSPALRAEIEAELDCIRQAGRAVCLRDPDHVPLDLQIEVCLEPDASASALTRRIADRLTRGRPAQNFFHPDNFTFGTALLRSTLEATVQGVPGVRGVEAIRLRRRGWHDFEPMPARIEVAPHQILQLANDPARPERGYVEISVHGGG